MHQRRWKVSGVLAVAAAWVCACAPRPVASAGLAKSPGAATASAIADLYPVRPRDVRGLLRLRATDQGVLIRGSVTGLQAGLYGLGIHEGDCSAFDAKSAGGYFVGPSGAGGEPLGRLDDLVIEHDGGGDVQRMETKLGLSGPNSIVGRALVIHAWPYDAKIDVKTVPFLACAVIRAE